MLLTIIKDLNIVGCVTLSVQIKLLPDADQSVSLKATLELANRAANRLSELAWETKEFRQFPLQRKFYYQVRAEFPALSSQMVIRLNAKVADAYKLDEDTKREFRKHGSISYDLRIYRLHVQSSVVNIWTVDGRKDMPFVCGERQRKLLSEFRHGAADLIRHDHKWFLNVSIDIPEPSERKAVEWLGIDLGLANIAVDSTGQVFGDAKHIAGIRARRFRQRKRLQKRQTRSARRVLKRLRGRESRFICHANHTISKQICAKAERTGCGIALENLTGIRNRIRAMKGQRRILHSWAFEDLQSKIAYKSRLVGTPVKFVDPRNTSRTCPACAHVSKKNRPTRASFKCHACGFTADADTNAAGNIARRAANRPAARTPRGMFNSA